MSGEPINDIGRLGLYSRQSICIAVRSTGQKCRVPETQLVLASTQDSAVKPSAGCHSEYNKLPSRTLLAVLVASKSGRKRYSLPSLSAASDETNANRSVIEHAGYTLLYVRQNMDDAPSAAITIAEERQ